MTRREQITAELARLGQVAQGLYLRQGAHMNLYSAALISRDVEEVELRRDELHTLLDALLDNGEAINRLARELESLP